MSVDRDRVFLTGASGFVGAHVLRELIASGYEVRALSRTSTLCHPELVEGRPSNVEASQSNLEASRSNLEAKLSHPERVEGPPSEVEGRVEIVTGDLRYPGEWARALYGCRYVIHCAALYSFAPSDRALTHRVNVVGTASLLEAARVAGVERVVLTSSSATLGASPDGRPRTEADWAAEGRGASSYHHSKLEQERAAFAARVPVVALLPTAPVGPGDWKPTPTGQMILDFARGKMVVRPPRGGLNLVPVEDVARAHVVALRRAREGERYILGGENLLLDRVWELLAEVTGKPLPHWRIPDAVALGVAYADELRCRVQRGAQPSVPLEGVRMSRERMFADSAKAQRELDFHAGSVRDALERAVRWYRAHDYCN